MDHRLSLSSTDTAVTPQGLVLMFQTYRIPRLASYHRYLRSSPTTYPQFSVHSFHHSYTHALAYLCMNSTKKGHKCRHPISFCLSSPSSFSFVVLILFFKLFFQLGFNLIIFLLTLILILSLFEPRILIYELLIIICFYFIEVFNFNK